MKKSIKLLAAVLVCLLFIPCFTGCKKSTEYSYGYQTQNAETKHNSGTVVYNGSVTYPVFEFKADKKSEKWLNEYFQQFADSVCKPEEDYALEYEQMLADGKPYANSASKTVDCSLLFCDEKTVSAAVFSTFMPANAAKQIDSVEAFCLSLETHKKLGLEDITDTPAKLKESVSSYVKNQLKRLENEGELSGADTEKALGMISDGTVMWCFGENTLNIYYDTGVIAPSMYPYVIIEIPLERLADAI